MSISQRIHAWYLEWAKTAQVESDTDAVPADEARYWQGVQRILAGEKP